MHWRDLRAARFAGYFSDRLRRADHAAGLAQEKRKKEGTIDRKTVIPFYYIIFHFYIYYYPNYFSQNLISRQGFRKKRHALKKRGVFAIKIRKTRKYKNQPVEKTHKNLPADLNESEIKVLNVLKDGPKHINKISNETGYPLGKIRAIATLLEIRGLVYTVEGNAYAMTSEDVWNSREARL